MNVPDGGVILLERLFVQYIRVKCLLHRILVHDPTDRGLDGFVHTFDQLRSYRKGLELVLPDFALTERGIDLGALEVRTAPPRVSEVRSLVSRLKDVGDERGIEFGWVFHFIRDARGANTGERYQRLFAGVRAAARRLRMAIELRPSLLWTFRGLDIAGSERAGPLWVVAPIFAQMRWFSQALAVRARVPPLQLTLHAGEDFRHLASGLRAIHEPFQWGLVARGDRLGHALALGVDPARWCADHPRVLVPRWERILDLAWMIGALEGRGVGLHGIGGDGLGLVLARMREELRSRLREVPRAERVDVDAAVRLHAEVFRAVDAETRRPREAVPRLMLQRRERPGVDDLGHLAWLRLFGSERTQGAFDEPVVVETAGELSLLVALSQALVRLVALWQVAIEVNPSSNLLIAGFDAPLEQPIFRLHPLDPGAGVALPITLNADDPLTFSTVLADEYAYAWAAMVLISGVAPGRAHAWLREAGNASWRARFTQPRALYPCEDESVAALQRRCDRRGLRGRSARQGCTPARR